MKGPGNFAVAKGSWPDLANAGEGSSEAMLIIIDWPHPPSLACTRFPPSNSMARRGGETRKPPYLNANLRDAISDCVKGLCTALLFAGVDDFEVGEFEEVSVEGEDAFDAVGKEQTRQLGIGYYVSANDLVGVLLFCRPPRRLRLHR